MICHVCQATGWSWDHVEDHLTVPRLRALGRYWAQSPPPHVLLSLIARGLLGIERFEAAAPSAGAAEDSWKELLTLAAASGSGLAIRGKPPA